MPPAPRLDERSAPEIFDEVARDLERRLGVDAAGADPMAEALLRVFARYGELIIQRLNRVPEKTHLAFLDTLELSRIPPLPARVPLTFSLVKKLPAAATVIVPAHTKVAAAPGPGDEAPVVFETTREIALTDLRLERVAVLDPRSDRWSDKRALAGPDGGPGEFVFLARTPVPHELYLRHDPIFGRPGIARLRVRLDLGGGPGPAASPLDVDWRILAPGGDVALTPLQDSTAGLTRSGDVVFADLPEWPEHDPFGRRGRWLACRLRRPLGAGDGSGNDGGRHDPLSIGGVEISARWHADERPVDAAHATGLPLDLTRDFYPFGDHPRFNDVFYVASDAFGSPGSTVALDVVLTNPASGGGNPSLPPVTKAGRPVIKWEYWSGRQWAELVVRDETDALTESGQVVFTVPPSMARGQVNGEEGFWVRARLVAGHYGHDERLEFTEAGAYRRIPSTLAPPSIQAISVSSWSSAGPSAPEAIVTHNNLVLEDVETGTGFSPFRRAREPRPALYLGFRAPADGAVSAFTERAIDLYCHVRGPGSGLAYLTDGTGLTAPRLTWQYWNGQEWRDATVSDTTGSLMVAGVVTFQAGRDAVPWAHTTLGPGLYWLRVLWSGGEFGCLPETTRLALNTVMATQTLTLENELLGSSTGKPGQTFRAARRPVLADLHLEVRDGEAWERWQAVEDWLSSTPDDRHALVNRETGEITFGDNVHGRVPPRGTNNVRLRRYQTGGGAAGNRPPGAIAQLRTTVPYVDAVINLEAAVGGQDLEDWPSLAERGARSLRHRDRAVTVEDYEDLARLASPRVALARCYPCADQATDPLGRAVRRGTVSVVVVPRGSEPRPPADLELLRRVRDFLAARCVPDVSLVVVAPRYVRVCVEADVVPQEPHRGAGVRARCEARLNEFLHPVTGGEARRGWGFGERPHESDLYAQLEAVDGVGHVRALRFRVEEEEPGALESRSFLISSGDHRIRLES